MNRKTNYSPRERVLAAIAHEEPDRLPVDTWMSAAAIDGICRQLGLPRQTDPYGMWHEGILERLEVDVRRPLAPYCGPPLRNFADGSWDTPLGVRRKGRGIGMALEHPLREATEIEQVLAYPLPTPDQFDYSGLQDYARRNAAYALVGGSKFPILTEACDLMGMDRVMTNLYDRPELMDCLFERIFACHLSLTQRWIEVAPRSLDAIIITDDFGGTQNLLISPAQWRRFLRPYLEAIVELAHSHGCKAMLHTDGAVRKLIPDLIELGLDILNPIEPEAAGMQPAGIKADFGRDLCLHGAVSNLNLAYGTPESVRAEVESLVQEVAPGGGFILCPSNHIMEDMPLENVLALYDAAHELGRYA